MRCLVCGAELQEDSRFCSVCGAAQSEMSKTEPDESSKDENGFVYQASGHEEAKILNELEEDIAGREDSANRVRDQKSLILQYAGIGVGALVVVVLIIVGVGFFSRGSQKSAPPVPPEPSSVEIPAELARPAPAPLDDRTRATVGQLAAILKALEDFVDQKGSLPASLSDISPSYRNPDNRRDGWGNEFSYLVDSANNRFRLRSPGPDAQLNSEDDLWISTATMEAWLQDHRTPILEWNIANPNRVAELVSASPAPPPAPVDDRRKHRAEEEVLRKRQVQALERVEKLEARLREKLEALRREELRLKEAQSQPPQEPVKTATAKETAVPKEQNKQPSLGFEENFNRGLERWNAPASWKIIQDREFSALRVKGLGLLKEGADWRNYSVVFEIKVDKESAGWIVRAQNPRSFYLFKLTSDRARQSPKNSLLKYIYSDGKYLKSLKREEAPGSAGITRLPFKIKNRNYYEVTVAVQGRSISHRIDGVLVDTWSDATFDRGHFGFNASAVELATIRSVTAASAR